MQVTGKDRGDVVGVEGETRESGGCAEVELRAHAKVDGARRQKDAPGGGGGAWRRRSGEECNGEGDGGWEMKGVGIRRVGGAGVQSGFYRGGRR